METCSFEGCERVKATRGLCAGHYSQYKRNKPLTPINERMSRRPHNKKYDADSVCAFEPCDRKPRSAGLCESHYSQKSKGHDLTVLGPRGGGRKKDEGTTRLCYTCGEVKDWKAIANIPDTKKTMCHDCWRAHLSRDVEVVPNAGGRWKPPAPQASVEDVLAFIEKELNASV